MILFLLIGVIIFETNTDLVNYFLELHFSSSSTSYYNI
jgi:hypothetical protein